MIETIVHHIYIYIYVYTYVYAYALVCMYMHYRNEVLDYIQGEFEVCSLAYSSNEGC